jgi:hypothetical protein
MNADLQTAESSAKLTVYGSQLTKSGDYTNDAVVGEMGIFHQLRSGSPSFRVADDPGTNSSWHDFYSPSVQNVFPTGASGE